MAARHRGVQRREARGDAAPPREVCPRACAEQPREQAGGATEGAGVRESLSVRHARLVASCHDAVAAQAPLGEELELVGREALVEGLDGRVVARLVEGAQRDKARVCEGVRGWQKV